MKLHKDVNPMDELIARMDALEEKVNGKLNKPAQKRNDTPVEPK
mgnify:CR=1 FL=1